MMSPGRRELKSYASGLANQFASSANHYAWLSLHYNITTITVDILNVAIDPVEFDIERNRNLIELCRGNLQRNLQFHGLQESVLSAELIANFDVLRTYDGQFGRYVPLSVTARITDDRGKSWAVVLNNQDILSQV